MGLPMQKERIYQDGLKVKMEPKNEPKPEPEPKLKPKPGTANAKSSKVVEKEPKPDKIEVPDITRCLYRTESEYKALVKTHSKNTDKVDKKQMAKHKKPDGSPGGYVATHNYQTINRALIEDDVSSLCDDDKATIEAIRRAIANNTLDQDSILTRYVNDDYISSKFGVFREDGSKLAGYELTQGYKRGKVLQQAIEAIKKKIGTTISSDAFMSTSMLKSKNLMSDKNVRLTIRAVKGTHCYAPTNKRESELIFGDDTKLYITDVAKSIDDKLEIFAILLE